MHSPNDINEYSRDRYKARQSARAVTRPASKYDGVQRNARPVRHDGAAEPHARDYDHRYQQIPRSTDDRRAYEQRRRSATEHAAYREAQRSFAQEPLGRRRRNSYASSASSYSLSSGNVAAFQHRGSKVPIVIGVVVALALAAAIYLFFNPLWFNVTVNGQQVGVTAFTTVQDLVDDGHASPKAGDLLAVDGTVAQNGGGQPFVATINDDVSSDPGARLVKDAVVTIDDGGDVEEDYDERIEALPYEESAQQATPTMYYVGSIHLQSRGIDGKQSVRTGKVSGKTAKVVIEQPVNAGFTSYTADVGDDKVIALTFDDGPWPTSTKKILDILKENDAHATFFVIGNQCKDNATVLKEVAAAGNQIGTHSYDHAAGAGNGVDLTLMTQEQQVKEIDNGFKAIEDVLGHSVSHVMRAPGGNYYGQLVTNLASHVTAEIGWDVDTTDWQHPGVSAIVNQLLSVKPGEVVLMHDGGGDRSETIEALSIALPMLKDKGFKFVTIDELLEYGVSAS